PAQEVLDLLLASRQAVTRRQRWWVGGSLTLTLGALALAALAYVQGIEATRQRGEAQSQAKIAAEQRTAAAASNNDALARESMLLRQQSNQALADGDATTALLLSLEAVPDATGTGLAVSRPYTEEAEDSLVRAIQRPQEILVIPTRDERIVGARFGSNELLYA